MTKNEIKAKLQLAINFAELCNICCENIASNLTSNDADELYTLLDCIKCGEETDVNQIMKRLEGKCFDDAHITETGDVITVPKIVMGNSNDIEIRLPVSGIGYITATSGSSDGISPQMSIGVEYEVNDDICELADLALVEVKKGELAKAEGLNPNNTDIDIYTYADICTDDYTHHDRIRMSDIEKIIG